MQGGAERLYNPLPPHHANCLSISRPAMLLAGGSSPKVAKIKQFPPGVDPRGQVGIIDLRSLKKPAPSPVSGVTQRAWQQNL